MNYASTQRRGRGRSLRLTLTLLLLAASLLLVACSPTPPQARGSLRITVAGTADPAHIAVSGPEGYSTTVTATTTLENLAAGDYSLQAAPAGNHFVTGELDKEVVVEANGTADATFTYARAFEFVAASDTSSASLGGALQLTGTLSNLHTDLTEVEVRLSQPSAWDLSAPGPWLMATAGSVSSSATDSGAAIGSNTFVFEVSGEIAGQALKQNVPVSVELLPMVTSTADNASSPAVGTLRYLVEESRIEGHTITFDPALASGGPVTVELEDQLTIGRSLSIDGYAAPATRVGITRAAGMGAFRLLQVGQAGAAEAGPEVELSRLELYGGEAPTNQHGGAILSYGELRVADSLVHGNQAHHGGAVHAASGSLTAIDVSFESNTAASWGGALFASNGTTIELRGSAFEGNQAQNGGALLVGNGTPARQDRATLLIADSDFTANSATAGGALTSYAEAEIHGSAFHGNQASGGGGAIRNHYRMVIGQESNITNNRASTYGGILNDGIMEIRDSEVRHNWAMAGDGGGIYNGYIGADARLDGTDTKSLLIVRSLLEANEAQGDGGGVYNVQLLEIVDSSFVQNEAEGLLGGGGVYSTSVTGSDPQNQRGTVVVSGSTFTGNLASSGAGGAIAVGVPAAAPGPRFTMLNSTVQGNFADGDGGGISLARLGGAGDQAVTAFVSFSTIASNRSIAGYGAGVHTRYGDLHLRGNVIANNVTQRPTANQFEHDLYAYAGSATSHGYNWVSTDASQGLNPVATDVTDTAITLGVLQFNSGPTKTKLPPAELGDVLPGHCLDGSGAQLTVDQRGQPRPGPNGTCYRGAVEPQSSELP